MSLIDCINHHYKKENQNRENRMMRSLCDAKEGELFKVSWVGGTSAEKDLLEQAGLYPGANGMLAVTGGKSLIVTTDKLRTGISFELARLVKILEV